MLCLKTLGSPVVEGSRGPLPGTAGQPKALALLALLAVAYQRGLSRDRLVGYLWPEVPPKTAAHRLNQLLYALRRDLGSNLGIARLPRVRAVGRGRRGRQRPALCRGVGRTRASTRLGTTDMYNPATDSWRNRSALPTARSFLAGGAIGGRLYAVAGLSSGTVNQAYTP
jgi:DNA-binding transcriptional activator of the SARP family